MYISTDRVCFSCTTHSPIINLLIAVKLMYRNANPKYKSQTIKLNYSNDNCLLIVYEINTLATQANNGHVVLIKKHVCT